MQIFKTLSIIACSSMLLIGCKTSKVTIVSNPFIYNINNTITEDSTIVNYYLPFKARMEAEMNRVIGTSVGHLNKDKNAETLIGNFFSDALLSLGKNIDPTVEIAFGTKGGIRAELKKGEITVGDIFQIMPFENAITILELKGPDLMTLFNFIAKSGGQPIAGLTMDIRDNKPENIKINGVSFDINKSYKVATYDYLANGGDYVEGVQSPINRINSSTLVREGLIQHVENLTKQGKTINTTLDGRVKVIK